jgi:redox-sensitive bicupin YhaK (pirin superfamily)
MKKILYPAATRGSADYGWLKTHYSFSFAEYHDPARMQFGMLRVLNDDWIAPGKGFSPHPHRDMEIITVMLAGALRHDDSTGGQHILHAGEVQVMSAGSGITHSEHNASEQEAAELLQIWIFPHIRGISPRYVQTRFDGEKRKDSWHCLVAPVGSTEAPLGIYQEAHIFLTELSAGKSLEVVQEGEGRGEYFFVISGVVTIAGEQLGRRDALAISGKSLAAVVASELSLVLRIAVPLL